MKIESVKINFAVADRISRKNILEMMSEMVLTPESNELGFYGIEIEDEQSSAKAASILQERGVRNVLIKGGHPMKDDPANQSTDRLYLEDGTVLEFHHERVPGEFHGTGCSLSTSIACNLARGMNIPDAVEAAGNFISRVLHASLDGTANVPTAHGTSLIDPFRGIDAR